MRGHRRGGGSGSLCVTPSGASVGSSVDEGGPKVGARRWSAALGAVLLAGCAGGSGEPSGEGVATVTERATATATETVTATETETVTEGPTDGPTDIVASGDSCSDLVGGESLAFVFVTAPAIGTQVSSPFTVAGCANAFEAAYSWELLDRDGAVLVEGFGTASCGTGCVGTFSFDVSYTVPERQVGTLRVFTVSAMDGSDDDVNAIPLVLEP